MTNAADEPSSRVSDRLKVALRTLAIVEDDNHRIVRYAYGQHLAGLARLADDEVVGLDVDNRPTAIVDNCRENRAACANLLCCGFRVQPRAVEEEDKREQWQQRLGLYLRRVRGCAIWQIRSTATYL